MRSIWLIILLPFACCSLHAQDNGDLSVQLDANFFYPRNTGNYGHINYGFSGLVAYRTLNIRLATGVMYSHFGPRDHDENSYQTYEASFKNVPLLFNFGYKTHKETFATIAVGFLFSKAVSLNVSRTSPTLTTEFTDVQHPDNWQFSMRAGFEQTHILSSRSMLNVNPFLEFQAANSEEETVYNETFKVPERPPLVGLRVGIEYVVARKKSADLEQIK